MKHEVAESETYATDLHDLRAFCLVVDLGSITAAARALAETKGSVSRRLTRLEKALGVALLRRSPRLVQATEDGVAYRLRVGRALELLDDANTQVQHGRAAPSGHLRITAPFDLALSIFAPLIARFSERFPAISIELLLTDAFLDFDAHQIDVALRATSSLQDSSLIAHKLDDVRGGLYAAPAYLKKHGTPAAAEDLERHRLLHFRAVRGVATLTLRRKGEDKPQRLRVRSVISATDFSFNRETALAGGGIAVLPTVVAKRDVTAGALVRVLPEYILIDAAIFLVHPGARFPPPKVQAFRDFMLAAFSARGRRAR
jgi:DNA-binding transcriptional LysR family regulator